MTKFWKPILAVLLVCTLALSGGALLAKPAASAASYSPGVRKRRMGRLSRSAPAKRWMR